MASIPSVAQAWRLPLDWSSWNGHKSLQLREVKISPPKKGEVLVRLHAAALNFRDILISNETYVGPPERSTGPDGQGLILTCDGAGEIVALGEGVTNWKKGDRVHSLFYETWFDGQFEAEYMHHTLGGTSPGCLAQYRVFTAESLLAIPSHLSYEEAWTIPCAALTAWHALFEKRPITDKSTVLVLGSGGVSVFGAQLAKAAGARVIATTSSKGKEEKYKSLGIEEIVNYREFPDRSIKVMELTGGKGVDHVLEIGGQGTICHSVKSIRPDGLVHVIGAVASSTPSSGSLSEFALSVLAVPANVSGILVGSNRLGTEGAVNSSVTAPQYQVSTNGSFTPSVIYGGRKVGGVIRGSKAMCERLDAFMDGHKIKPVIDRVFEWKEVVEALDHQLTGGHFGKIVVKID